MSEQELREGLLVAVLDEPPLAFDPDALMARAHRESARRKALVGAGVATTAVAVAAVAVPTLLGSPGGGGVGGVGWGPACGSPPSMSMDLSPVPTPPPSPRYSYSPEPTPTNPPDPSVEPPVAAEPCPSSFEPPSPQPTEPALPPAVSFDWPPPNVVPVRYTAEQLTQRGTEMRGYLGTQFVKVVRGATKVTPGVFGGEAAGAVSDGQTYLEAFTGFTLNGIKSAVDIYVSAPGATDPPLAGEECAHGRDPLCTVEQRADGSWVVTKPETLNKNGNAIVSVIHYRANGSVVRAAGYNYDPLGEFVPGKMPVTVEQLTALATDPSLGL